MISIWYYLITRILYVLCVAIFFLKCILAYVSIFCVQHESLGPNGGFSYYVFMKLHESRQFSQLLRLGEEFPDELSIFLREHPDLLWLHDLFLHQFSSASETLHALALLQNMQSTSVAEEEGEQEYMKMKLKLTDRKNLLFLSKVAAFAGMALCVFHVLWKLLPFSSVYYIFL